MKIIKATVVLLATLAIGAMGMSRVQTAMVVPAPELERVKWENHRLRAANMRLQIETLTRSAAVEDQAADALIDVMQKVVGEKYGPRISQAGVLEFALKETKPSVEKKPGDQK